MLAFNHILAGSIVAVITPAPLLPALPVIAFTSHFLLDMMPHAYGEEPPYSRMLKIQIGIDAVVSIAVIIFLLFLFPPDKWFLIGTGAFFGLLPDFLWILWRRGPKWLDKILDFAHWIQWGERTYGWMFDAFYGFLMVMALLALTGNLH